MMIPKNGAPRAVFEGMIDDSAREPIRNPFRRPIHLPWVMAPASWGPETDQFVSGDQIKEIYGEDFFDRRAPHFTHANLIAEVFNSTGNGILINRIVPEDANPPAGFTIWVDRVLDNIPNYQRNSDMTYKLDNQGEPIIDTANPTVIGYRYRLTVTELSAKDNVVGLGNAVKRAGELLNSDSQASEMLPILEMRVPHRGSRGDLAGMRLGWLTTSERNGARRDVVASNQAGMFRVQFVERPRPNKTPLVKPAIGGAQSIDVSFKTGAYDERMKRSVDIREILLDSFNRKSTDGGPDRFGVFSEMHIYENNLSIIQNEFLNVEGGNGTLSIDGGEPSVDLVNWLTATSVEGIPYFNVRRDGGAFITSNTTVYAVGGSDGTVNNDSFEEGVVKMIDTFKTSPLKLWDSFRVPMSVFYDSGFTVETKLKLCRLVSLRDDIAVFMSTQTYGEPLLSESEEFSVGQALSQELLSYPESVVNGTQTCRGMVLGNGGVRPAFNVGNKVVPAICFHLSEQLANWGGAANRRVDPNWLPSLPSRNVIRGYSITNAQSKSDEMIDDFWERGIVYAQYKDRSDIFVPAYQSVYEDDTSVFNSMITVLAMVEVIKITREVWSELTGQTGLSEEQFILRSDSLIIDRVGSTFGPLLRVEPNTYFSAESSQLGYPWNCRIRCSGPMMRTVGLFEVVGARIEN